MDALVDIPERDRELLLPPWGAIGRACTLGVVSGVAKLTLTMLNSFHVENREAWVRAVYDRPKGTGLITIANHTSMFDDPGVICALTPWSFFWTEPWHQGNRWTLCAKEVCFRNEFLRQFFANGKALPIVRGEGVQQPVMRLTSSLIAEGGWVQVFPEGRIKFDGELGPFRGGVGKLVCDARRANGGRDPMVLPFFHSGMGRILPLGAWVPRPGHDLHVAVGEPVELSDITCNCHKPGVNQEEVWERIVLRMREAVQRLEARVPPNVVQIPPKPPTAQQAANVATAPPV